MQNGRIDLPPIRATRRFEPDMSWPLHMTAALFRFTSVISQHDKGIDRSSVQR
jgi:hypothetical protein